MGPFPRTTRNSDRNPIAHNGSQDLILIEFQLIFNEIVERLSALWLSSTNQGPYRLTTCIVNCRTAYGIGIQCRLAIVHSKRKSLKFTVADLHCSEMPLEKH